MKKSEIDRALEEANGNITQAAKLVGMPRTTFRNRMRIAEIEGKDKKSEIRLPQFAEEDVEIESIIETMKKRFRKRYQSKKERDWFDIKVSSDDPIGVTFFGDPHVGDNFCNWPLLDHHCKLLRETPGMYAVNIGDTANNWAHNLVRLYADQDTSRETERRLAGWFLKDSGINWLCWLMGNHDLWTEFPEIMRQMNVKQVPMVDWQARFVLNFPNKRACRIWAAHSHPGHSMWNSLHGPQKAAHMKSEADIYASGHTHNWAIHQEESASRSFTYWLIRSRGYKFMDDHSEKMGHFPQLEGASITCIINPKANSMAGYIQAFADMDMAVEYLNFLRK